MKVKMPAVAVSFQDVDILFGDAQSEALALLDAGAYREKILEESDVVLGVAGASIDIHEGEICVLMGLSGSGKSTLLRAVNGLNKVTRGQVFIQHEAEKIDIAHCNAELLRSMRMHRIAMVFQQFALMPWRTVEENVGLGLELQGMSRAERKPIVEEKLKLVDLYQWRDKFAHELSGGMQQRVGLARAFATDADILLMDEPFSALDPLIRNHLQDFLLDLQREFKKTIIFVSHDLDEALKIGNHIAIMDEGRIVQYGEAEDIIVHPANEYVAEFVAHMNPLNVLKGATFMTPVEQIEREGQTLILEGANRIRLKVDNENVLISAICDEKEIQLVDCGPETIVNNLNGEQLVKAPSNMKMRWNIEVRHQTGHPVLLVENGRLVGVIGDKEIYSGILRQTASEKDEQAA